MAPADGAGATGTAGTEGPADRSAALPALSRRRFLAGAGTAAGTALLSPAAAATAAARDQVVSLRFTAATNGAADIAPSGDRLIAEVQHVLWSLPRTGGTAVPLTPAALEPSRPVHSPDGSLIAFCAYRDGVFHVWTMRPDGSEIRRRTDGPWDDRGPAWSPDGTRIAFASERGGDPVTGAPYRIWVLDLRTGRLTAVSGLPGQAGPLQDGRWEDFDPVWTPDGARILCVRAAVVTTASGTSLEARTVVSLPADGGGGPVTVVHTESTAAQVLTPALSPDGKRLAHLRTTPAPHGSCTLVVDGEPVAVPGDVAPVPPRWTAGGELLLTVDGRFCLVRPEAPRALEPIPFRATLPVHRPRYRAKTHSFEGGRTRPVRGIHLPALAPDGRRIAFAALNSLWLAGTAGGRPPRRLVRADTTSYLLGPAWAPDGESLVYADDSDGLLAVYRHDLATGARTALATGGRVHPALSPDGGRLACLDLTGRLVVMDLATGTERVLAAPLGGGGLPGRPSWSPDGRFLALCDRNRLNMRFREGYNLIRVVDTATGAARLHAVAPHTSISDRYGSGPVWSPDGRWMAVIVESALCLLPVTADGRPAGPLRTLSSEPADHPSWSADSRTLLHLSGTRLRLTDIDGGEPRTVRVPLDYRRPAPADTVVRAGRLWDGTGGDSSVREDVDVVVRAGRVAAVEPHRPPRARPAARRVDASDHTVLPGLWDAHSHPWPYTYGGRQTACQLAYGMTTAVSLGGFAHEQARIREAVEAGQMAGPRLLSCGELLDGSRVAYSMGRAHRTREGLRRSLERGVALDWDVVKTYVRAPGWVMEEAARFAHERLGVRVGSHFCSPGVQTGQDLTSHLQATQRGEAGHAVTAAGRAYQDVSELYSARGAGFTLIATPFTARVLAGADPALAEDERVTALMPPWDAALVRQMAAQPPSEAQLDTLRTEIEVYRRVLAAGGLVALGTDAPIVPVGLSLHLNLRALHLGGLSPAEALRTATLLPARAFALDRDLGTVEVGKVADLTVVDGDPFRDFATLVRTVSVLKGGVPHERAALVGAFRSPGARRAQEEPRLGARDWLEVGCVMRRDGCCSPDTAHG
ncbi:amidohydrolase [Streptomyces sp. WAC05374]|uniref:amidohydrolase family protein n=1 Tax=Streptomyces sp. WAC05374 TaxID=2487420 RepID=UPI000F881E61|nr:amidohydrolase [Streptomyces sp. WAC05374]TDF46190.1 amidohydrolase [Streptomyces sp. WAC05374]TDF48160.1 amidohydrolase [Streptomyces sp. WAC05374]TDF53105.1 amidohydrolase [Streptomyces sp. WAC05374]